MVSNSENAICKPELYESRRIQLTSPMLHIGSEVQKLSPFEYVQTSSRVYLPNLQALAKELDRRGRLQDYISRIENPQERTTLLDLLESTFGENWSTQKTVNGEQIFPETGISRKWTEEKITDFRPMIRNGFGYRYIPGSSIKGAIRTAIAYYLLKHEEDYNLPSSSRVSEIESRLRNSMGEVKRKAKSTDEQLFMNDLFSDFSLVYQDKRALGQTSLPNTDFMRAVQVTDTEPIVKEPKKTKQGKSVVFNLPVAVEVMVSSRYHDFKAKYRA
ncbi:MAG: type III-A CRISPR-associated RAMP protein Csm5, partial [Microcoleus sp. CAN_BIN18]|nr:type III-A CRISPR-associated RAMP protein Csm5 [Microcoleus sp. CAN_BIN18]